MKAAVKAQRELASGFGGAEASLAADEANQLRAAKSEQEARAQQEKQFQQQLGFQKDSFADQMKFQINEFNENLKTNFINSAIALRDSGFGKLDKNGQSKALTQMLATFGQLNKNANLYPSPYRQTSGATGARVLTM